MSCSDSCSLRFSFWKPHLTMSVSELKFFCEAKSWPDTKEVILDSVRTCPSSYAFCALCCPDAVWLSQRHLCAALLTAALPTSLCRDLTASSVLPWHLDSVVNTVVVPRSFSSTGNQTLDCTFLIGNKTILFSFIQAQSRQIKYLTCSLHSIND